MQFFRAVDAAITVLLHWIVALLPYVAFAIGLALATPAGGGIVSALAEPVRRLLAPRGMPTWGRGPVSQTLPGM